MKHTNKAIPGQDLLMAIMAGLGGGKKDLGLMLRGALQRIMAEDGWVSRADYDALARRVSTLESGKKPIKPSKTRASKATSKPRKKVASK